MKFVIGLGSIMFIDRQGHERFVPIWEDKENGLQIINTEELGYADLGLVGDELTPEGITLNDYWDKVRKAVA
jgi:hypothetical protein